MRARIKIGLWITLSTRLALADNVATHADGISEMSRILEKHATDSPVETVPRPKRKHKITRGPASIPSFTQAPKKTPSTPKTAKPETIAKPAASGSDRFPAAIPKLTDVPPAQKPSGEMRDLDADRPGVTDSPRTIDAGHVQLELGILSWTRNRSSSVDAVTGATTTTTKSSSVYSSAVLAVGLTPSLEAQLTFDGITHQNTDTAGTGTSDVLDGTGHAGVRLKYNLVGNDGGPTAIGVLVGAHFPTGFAGVAARKGGGNIELPLALEVAHGWTLSLMPSWAVSGGESDNNLHSSFSTGVILGHELFEGVSPYIQAATTSNTEGNAGPATIAGTGFAVKVSPNIQLDLGANFGLTSNADGVNISSGIVLRR